MHSKSFRRLKLEFDLWWMNSTRIARIKTELDCLGRVYEYWRFLRDPEINRMTREMYDNDTVSDGLDSAAGTDKRAEKGDNR